MWNEEVEGACENVECGMRKDVEYKRMWKWKDVEVCNAEGGRCFRGGDGRLDFIEEDRAKDYE